MSQEISQIREFLKKRLLETDKDFKEYKKTFNDDQVGANKFNKSFHIGYGAATLSAINQTSTQDDFTAVVELFFDNSRGDSEKQIDAAMDLANAFRMNVIHPKHTRNISFIKQVRATGLNPSPLNGNDQSFKISLQFSFRTVFGIGANFGCE